MKDTAKQQRDTKQRRMVYDAVMHHTDHPSVDEIYSEVHAAEPKISKATVYRNLKILSENKEITHVRVPGADRYDFTLDNHYHMICVECLSVFDAPIPYIAENDDSVAEKTGFCITRHRTVFEGICPACQKKITAFER